MQSKLARYSDGLMEAAWLAALIIVPVFFNVYSSRIFEPDKIALLRSLALVGVGAWAVRVLDEGRFNLGRLKKADESVFRSLLRIPMVPAVLAIAAVYLAATVFSISPRISLFGSYQRLQGTYTTLSYLLFFVMVAAHLRKKEQIDRLVTTVILSSLAISIYAVLQKYQIDPIPWGGDTAERVAANLGNAIFVAAYLILAFPLTLGRIVDSFTKILDENNHRLAPQVAGGVVYVFAAALQLIAVYFSLSRGPILGLLAGTFFMLVLLSLYWGKRWLTLTTVGAAAALGIFLLVFSIPGGPFDSLRSNENLGRIGNVFQTDGGTGRVRVLIWEGAARLTGFHAPLEYPDGTTDSFNFLRPFIGYGPETMYVAYNPFYPPELGSLESRNATPDRSHNETWDAVVITGWLGLAAEQLVFLTAFFFGLKWLGLIRGGRQRPLFFTLTIGGGLLSAGLFSSLAGPGFLGVGLPFGILLGLLAYLTLIAVFSRYESPQSPDERARSLTLMMFLGAIIAHYVEIHFGIAIGATRLYFWVFYGVMLAAGYWMTLDGSFGQEAVDNVRVPPGTIESRPKRKSGRQARVSLKAGQGKTDMPEQKRTAWIAGLLGGILLSTLSFNYLTNAESAAQTGAIIFRSLTRLPGQEGASFGILGIFLITWIASSVLAASTWSEENESGGRYVLLMTAGISAATWLIFSFIHASGLTGILRAAAPLASDTGAADQVLRQSSAIEGLLTRYYLAIFGLVLLTAARLVPPQRAGGNQPSRSLAVSAGMVGVVGLLAIFAGQSNLRVIQADMVFKIADSFNRGENPDGLRVALQLYKRANSLAPQQDHYYLFMGRGYLELTRLVLADSPQEAQELLNQAEADLKRAQAFNPLNTDHTANLARLYRFWSDVPGSTTEALLVASESNYRRALVLSPNNSGIWNELGTLYIQKLREPQKGLDVLEQSLEIDPFNDATYAILGDYYSNELGGPDEDSDPDAVNRVAGYYAEAMARARRRDARYLYAIALGGVHVYAFDYTAALDAYFVALENASASKTWQVQDTIAKVYARMEEYDLAIDYARSSLMNAPEEQRAAQQQLVEYLTSLQETP